MADQRDAGARFGIKADVAEHTAVGRVRICEGDVLEPHLAARRPQGAGVVFLRHAAALIEDAEKVFQRRQLEEQGGDEGRGRFQAANQQHREAHEADDFADAGHAVHVQPGADDNDRDHRQGAGRTCHDVDQRPPVQHGKLVPDDLVGDVAEQPRLRRKPGKGLHHHDVGQGILGSAGQRGVQALYPALRGFGLLHNDCGEHQEHADQHEQHKPKAPVQQQRHRQQHDGRQDGGQLVAEEHQPCSEQAIGAGEHRLDQAARMRLAVKRQRQRQDMLEIAAHGLDAVAVCKAFCLQRHHNVADDTTNADSDPDTKQDDCFMPKLRVRQAVRPRQQVDNPPEQHGIEELQARDHQVSEGEEARYPDVTAEKAEHPAISFEESHLPVPAETEYPGLQC